MTNTDGLTPIQAETLLLVEELLEALPDITGKSYYWGGLTKRAIDALQSIPEPLSTGPIVRFGPCEHKRLASAPTTGGGSCIDCGHVWPWQEQAAFDRRVASNNAALAAQAEPLSVSDEGLVERLVAELENATEADTRWQLSSGAGAKQLHRCGERRLAARNNLIAALSIPRLEASVTEDALLLRELRDLACVLHRRHFWHVKQWQPLDDARGILSQIDNMTAGLGEKIDKLEALTTQGADLSGGEQ